MNELAQVLMEYGQRQSNPVLDVIPEDGLFQANKKYPQKRLRFGNDQWRAYYHTHDDGHPDSVEHGHFHIFFRIDHSGKINKDWTHVVGLSMDRDGQPIEWFTVNSWVTGDTWVESNDLADRLELNFEEYHLINRWLGSLISFYSESIINLLDSRDSLVNNQLGRISMKDFHADRDVYYLSRLKIELLSDLNIALSQ